MRHWVLHEIKTPQGTRSPVVLDSRDGGERAVLIELRAGEALGQHSVKESTLLLVLDGSVRVERATSRSTPAPRSCSSSSPTSGTR